MTRKKSNRQQYYSVKDLEEITGRARRYIYNLINTNQLKAIPPAPGGGYLIKIADWEAFVESKFQEMADGNG